MKASAQAIDRHVPAAAHAFPIAAITYDGHAIADALLADFALGLRRKGWRVRGLVQRDTGGGKSGMMLVDLENDTCYPLFQALGSASSSCSLDTESIAAASTALRRALDESADLVFANRFGALEASGGGLAAEMLALMAEGVPLMTVVSEDYLLDWRWFTGKAGVELPPARSALEDWFFGIAAKKDRNLGRLA